MKFYFRRMFSKEKCPPRKPIHKIIWSWIGAFLGIYLCSLIGNSFCKLGFTSLHLVGSFGASAVLVYGAPMAEFSQPRNLIGGNLISAIIGVTLFKILGANSIFTAPLAVSLAILLMHLTRTLHPPGGATALIAIIGEENIHSLGYLYVFCPILAGSLIILLVALFVNNMSNSPQRHYPLYWY